MNQKMLPLLASVIVLVSSPLSVSPARGAEPAPSYAPVKADSYTALFDPDRFAWQLFCAISGPAGNGHPQDIIWETWALEDDIYANPNVAPTWPSSAHRPKRLSRTTQQRIRAEEMSAHAAGGQPTIPTPRDGVANQEDRDNREVFDYILANNLWYQEGVADKVRDGRIDFPTGSIAIKGKWKVIAPEQKERFHWQEYTDPVTNVVVVVGLVALHITSRVMPNWHWSTFEQVDNPGIADYIGIHDSFGIRPTDIAPNRSTNQGYANTGVLTDEVKAMMAASHLSPALSKYYRLKGSQIDFIDRTGRQTILGSSITEAGFVSGASCITCHSRASVGAPYQGQNNVNPPPALSVFTPRGESYNGPPNPTWYWDRPASFSSPPAEPEAFRQPVGFLWQLSVSPQPRNPPPKK